MPAHCSACSPLRAWRVPTPACCGRWRSFNQLRSEKKALQSRYTQLEQVIHEKDIQVASLGSLANEVSVIYGLKPNPQAAGRRRRAGQAGRSEVLHRPVVCPAKLGLDGAATAGLGMGYTHQATLSDWIDATTAPTLWPVIGPITGAFGERIDPFNGEGAFHSGVDISCHYGQQVMAPVDGIVTFADFYNGYGRMIQIDHGNGITTRYGHLSGFAVADGQSGATRDR